MSIATVVVKYDGKLIGTHEVFGTDMECMIAAARMFGVTLGTPKLIVNGKTVTNYRRGRYWYSVKRDGL